MGLCSYVSVSVFMSGSNTDSRLQSQLLLRVLASVLPEGKGVDWKNVNMPGRTQKALQHQWTTVLAQIRDLNIGGDGTVTTPAKPRAGGFSQSFKSPIAHSLQLARRRPRKLPVLPMARAAMRLTRATRMAPPSRPLRSAALLALVVSLHLPFMSNSSKLSWQAEGSAKKRRAPKKSTPKVEDEAEEEDGEAKAEENVEEEQ